MIILDCGDHSCSAMESFSSLSLLFCWCWATPGARTCIGSRGWPPSLAALPFNFIIIVSRRFLAQLWAQPLSSQVLAVTTGVLCWLVECIMTWMWCLRSNECNLLYFIAAGISHHRRTNTFTYYEGIVGNQPVFRSCSALTCEEIMATTVQVFFPLCVCACVCLCVCVCVF